MEAMRYLDNVVTLMLDESRCVGCGMCTQVCPHGVLAMAERTVRIVDRDGCMECGACANNCPTEALAVTPGVGCASYIIQSWIKGKENASCGGSGCC
ncbi:MAG: 4Fe-4S binding protein [Desulfatitalea sp.]|nr:4Fe-4S binding protein [Desulfatitalea sp.]NNK00784.1 4Fe-4S binding protein [Desulfatitalea sp.]